MILHDARREMAKALKTATDRAMRGSVGAGSEMPISCSVGHQGRQKQTEGEPGRSAKSKQQTQARKAFTTDSCVRFSAAA
jgi:hypothetical protein